MDLTIVIRDRELVKNNDKDLNQTVKSHHVLNLTLYI